ncbi:hypothetical protein LUZ63_000993 [Rhynchospora breviuscula]|uniref:Uncharacterized protein n=1 Tax=Rhynchospora breviuscula TaxID=2022672 RepID=A0A9Q0CVY5_9POAL|nr:hypothetical protein LUZ63_000993 [Rhynchospora breviuscula]
MGEKNSDTPSPAQSALLPWAPPPLKPRLSSSSVTTASVGPTRARSSNFLIKLPSKYPRQRHVFLCGNHDLAFLCFVGTFPARPDRSTRWSDTWELYAQNEEREGWHKGEGYNEMHVQGRRWGGSVDLMKAVTDEHKKFLHDLVWVHEEDIVAIHTENDRIECWLIAMHAGLEKTKKVEERLQVLRSKDPSLHTVKELRGRMNIIGYS